jgi:5-methylcytosine-specific restriction endonuclease McrA
MKQFKEYKGFENCERINLTCTTCGEQFQRYKCLMKKSPRIDANFCSKRCWYDYKSKNKITWNTGRTKATDPRLNYERPTSFKKGEHRSPETQFKPGQMSGTNSPTWKGGVTSVKDQVTKHYKYRQWRDDVFTRDDYTCQNCNTRGARLHAHHKERFSEIIESNQIKTLDQAIECNELWNINNGITLCVSCHSLTHGYLVPNFVIRARERKK